MPMPPVLPIEQVAPTPVTTFAGSGDECKCPLPDTQPHDLVVELMAQFDPIMSEHLRRIEKRRIVGLGRDEAQKLCSLKLLNTPDLETLMAEICCDQNNKECMYNDCGNCKEKEFTLLREYEGSTQVAYMQWVTEDTKGQTKDNVETSFKKTVKKKVETTLDDLIELFNVMLVKFKRHAFNIRQQYRYSRELKRNMAENELVHFLSDGPCTQYRLKGNFYLFTFHLHKKGFQAGTWNFF
ncbi:hypothetical protein DPX16_0245 [Anabarilius grahami]|uniref:Uncharacterized protein n=1 Tax=Anabarilius grahami TaxID=495550 RepID=A0A3N0YQD6_ANAGA|nr:hypothetical protein DPX16_0245 [Anabarilius grahami]